MARKHRTCDTFGCIGKPVGALVVSWVARDRGIGSLPARLHCQDCTPDALTVDFLRVCLGSSLDAAPVVTLVAV